jgi:hypothetical protein
MTDALNEPNQLRELVKRAAELLRQTQHPYSMAFAEDWHMKRDQWLKDLEKIMLDINRAHD